MTARKKVTLGVIAGVLVFLLLAAAAVGAYYSVILKRTLEQVAAPQKQNVVFSVYVLADDAAKGLEDTAALSYGINRSEPDQDSMTRALGELGEMLGKELHTVGYDSLFSLVDGLQQQEIRVILLNEALLDSLAETEGYEWTAEGLRKLESVLIGQEELTAEHTEGQSGTAEESVRPPSELPQGFVVYISGIDRYGGLTARSRSDVNILAAVNTKTKNMQLVATPRDYYVTFSRAKGQKDKLTHAGIYGVEMSVDALERLYGVEIDYWLRLNFTGFVEIIDALGGIDIYSEHTFTVKNIKTYQTGINQVNGLEALAFARERYSFANGDYQRAKNQMEVIRAVIDKCTSPALLKNYRSVMDGIAGSFSTNMPEDQILSLARIQLASGGEWKVSSYTVSGTGASRETYSMPGRKLYVILPDQKSVSQAKALLAGV